MEAFEILRLFTALGFFTAVVPAFGQFAGPAVLSRGEAPAAMVSPQISFRPYLEVTGVYDSGLTGVTTDQQGDIANVSGYGVELTGGISGVHSWKRTVIGLDYRGSYRHYTKQTYFDSSDQTLMFSLSHRLTRHITLTLQESAGIFSGGFGLFGLPQTVQFDPSTNYVPTTDFYDNRTAFLSTSANLIYQKSARLSFAFQGQGTLVRRRSSALYGVTGGSARADIQYRVSRRTTVGTFYGYTHYDYTGALSGADIHMAALSYATRLTKWWEISAYAGASRAETRFIQSVPLDPAIQALLGVTTGTQVAYSILYGPLASVRISRTFPRGVAYVSGDRGITPGNGLFLTSTTTSVTGGYTYTGLRRWSFGANVSQYWSNSFGNIVGRYNNLSAGLTATRQIVHAVHFVASFNAERYTSPDFSNYNRPVYSARIGLGFAPGDVPLRIW
jgi:hypothetical protein